MITRAAKKIIRRRALFFRTYVRLFKGALKQQIQPVLNRLNDVDDFVMFENEIEGLIREEPIEKVLKRCWIQVGTYFAQFQVNELKSMGVVMETKSEEEDLWVRRMTQWAEAEAGINIVSITGESKRQALKFIRQTMTEASMEGWGIEKIQREMRRNLVNKWGEMSIYRSRMIAQTEIIGASNRASFMGAQSAGIELVKSWLIGSGNPRDTHIEAANFNVHVPMSKPFIVGGYECEHPGDASLPAEEVINCHCCVDYAPI